MPSRKGRSALLRAGATFFALVFLFLPACDDSTGPEGGTGDLRVLSTPSGASVTVSGVRTGMTTPALIDRAAAGDYIVRIFMEGYVSDPESLVVTVAAGSEATASFALTEPVVEPDAERIVLIEHFTSASCTGCPTAHAAIEALVAELGFEKVITVGNHMNWPVPNTDPFFLENPVQLMERRAQFGVGSLPFLFVDGARLGNPESLYETLSDAVETAREEDPSFAFQDLAGAVEGDSFVVSGTVERLAETAEGDEALVVVVIETGIEFDAMNGLTHFDDVARWFLPGTDGETLALAAGETVGFRYAVAIPEAWERENLEAVALVESRSTRKVYQAGHTR